MPDNHIIALPSLDGLAQSGVYFLYRQGRVVYVGQAVDVRRRVASHIGEGFKIFDAVSFVACDQKDLASVEKRFIQELMPEYNRCGIANSAKSEAVLSGATPKQPDVIALHYNETGAAEFTGLSLDEFRKIVSDGRGPRMRRVGPSRDRKYMFSDLRLWISEREAA